MAETTVAEPADLYFLRPAERPDLLGMLGPYEVQEVIGQVWTGTARTAARAGGVRTERTFELGYLEYSSLVNLLRGTGKKLWFLMDPVEDAGGNGLRRWGSGILLVLAAVLLFVGLLSAWANTTVYDSTTFSERAVDMLNEPTVRRELAKRLTEQLALSGNQQAVAFRPAFQLAIEAAVDTDSFKSIFRTAVQRTHAAILTSGEGAAGLNLSDSISIIASTLQLPNDLKPGQREGSSLGNSLEDITKKASDLWVFKAKNLTGGLASGGLIGASFTAAGAVALATDRRRAVLRLGIAIVVVGLLLGALVPLVQWFVGRSVGDAQLASAVRGALGRAMADLQTIGLWIAAYGVVAAAAAASMGERHQRLTPRRAADAIGRWVQRRRQTTWGTVVLGVLAIFVATLVTQESAFWSRAAVFIAGLWLAYFGVTELLGLVRKAIPVAVAEGRSRTRRIALVAGAVVALAGVVTGGLLPTAGRAARRGAGSCCRRT